MKFLKLTGIMLSALLMHSCSSSDSDPVNTPETVNPETPAIPENPENPGNPGTPAGFAMTAKINGTQYNMKNPFGVNEATISIFGAYPDTDYIQLQGWVYPMDNIEIDIFIKRSQLQVGTIQVGYETDGVSSHIDLINNNNNEGENTVAGAIHITFVDTVNKIVKGTFEFTTSANANAEVENPVINYTVTDGTFNYKYDVN